MAMARFGVELCTNLDTVSTSTNQITNRRWTHSSVLLILLLCAFSPRVHGQTLPPTTSDDQAGEQAYMSYHGGDIDSISLTNGGLSLNFPLLTYPQRGKLHLSFNLMFHNSLQHQEYVCISVNGKQTCQWAWGLGATCCLLQVNWGQNLQLHGQSISQVVGIGKGSTTEYYSNFALQMADGSRHPLGNLGTISWTNPNTGCASGSGYTTCEIQSGPFETLDATGWRVNGSLEACPTQPTNLGGCYGVGQAVDPDGVMYGIGTYPSLQDPNGNQITSGATGVTDSLGRLVPFPPNANSTHVAATNCPVVAYPPGVASIAASYAVLWTVPSYNSGTAQYTLCYGSIPSTFLSGVTTQTLLQSIVLPNGQSWQFQYYDVDPSTGINFASLSQITLPTGGTISYTYTYGGQYHGTLVEDYGRWVASRTVNANDGTGSHTWTYAYSNPDLLGGTTTVTDPLGNDVVHTFGFGNQYATYENTTQYYQGSHSSGTLLKTVNTTYSSQNDYWQSNAPLNVVPSTVSTVWGTGQSAQTSTVTKSYDSGYTYTDYLGNTGESRIYGKVVTQQDYDYPSGTSLLRTTTTNYAWQSPNPNYSSYLTNNLLSLPYSVQVTGSGNSATTTYGYDEAGGLVSSGITEQKVAGESYPGNQTSVHRLQSGTTTATTNCNVSVSNGYLVSKKVFYDTGEVSTGTDPCGYTTTYQYSSTYYGAFPTTVTNALSQNTTYIYDFDTGAVTSITDPNSQITTKGYDILTRLTSVNYPDGGSRTYCYTDMGGTGCTQSGPPYEVVATQAITSSLNKITTVVFDGLGRLSQTQLSSDTTGIDYTLTTYDADGRKSQVYNPTRCNNPMTTNCGETTWGYTTNSYDALGRVTSVVEQDGSTVSTNYSAFPCTTVTDEVSNSRQSCVDGLGRMTSVLEDPGSSPHLNYSTAYTYDALGNLTYVNQTGSNSSYARTRSFSYDSLSELTSAQNPESGTIGYTYDADGNVVTKTAPSPNQASTGTKTVVTTYGYDKLNRLTGKSYADSYASNPATAISLFAYDGSSLTGCSFTVPSLTDSYPVGRRTSMCDGSGAAAWSHDKMGRILSEDRTIGTVKGRYDNDAYNLDGSIQSLTALGYNIKYTYNSAGQPITSLNASDSFNFVTSATYAPPGEVTAMSLGASGAQITVTNAYNDRLQPILLSATTSSSTVFSECFDFHLGIAITAPSQCALSAYSTGDNGNVYTIVNERDSTRTQKFQYDALNRITQGQSSGTQWGETYTIDAWGNLTTIGQVSGQTNHESLSQSALTNNQLTGFTYDLAGNMTVNGSSTYFYDAENRLIATAGMSYIYDGDGDRVEKCTEGTTPGTCASGATGTMYWRGTSPDPQAETDLSGNVLENYIFFNGHRIARREPTKAVHFYFSDHLGSHGVVTNASGTTCEQDIDYYPYGGQENDYCPNVAQHYKFNGKERDTESGLDNFGARYDNSALGRFMTPDWAAKPVTVPYAKFGDPQTLNLYSFTENGPINRIDSDGHAVGADDAVIVTAAAITFGVMVTYHILTQPQTQHVLGDASRSAVADLSNAVHAIGSLFHKVQNPTGPKQPKANPWEGKPGETVHTTHPDGSPKQDRRYGPDGFPETDVDHGHAHDGAPDPHAHDIGRPSDGSDPTNADRGPGRDVQPTDPQPQQPQQTQPQPQQEQPQQQQVQPKDAGGGSTDGGE